LPRKFILEHQLFRARNVDDVQLNPAVVAETFTWQEPRTLSSSLALQYDQVLYLVEPTRDNQRLAGKRVAVIDFPDGPIKIRYEGRELKYREFDPRPARLA